MEKWFYKTITNTVLCQYFTCTEIIPWITVPPIFVLETPNFLLFQKMRYVMKRMKKQISFFCFLNLTGTSTFFFLNFWAKNIFFLRFWCIFWGFFPIMDMPPPLSFNPFFYGWCGVCWIERKIRFFRSLFFELCLRECSSYGAWQINRKTL